MDISSVLLGCAAAELALIINSTNEVVSNDNWRSKFSKTKYVIDIGVFVRN